MYQQPRFSLITTQQVVGHLKATGSTDPDVLAAAKDQIAGPYRPLKWFGIWGMVTGALCTVMIVLAFIGIPVFIFGVWAFRRAKKNAATIDAAYDEYVGKASGSAPALVPGEIRAGGVMLLGLLLGSGSLAAQASQFAQVPAEFHGDWVSAKATCDAPLRFRVEVARVTLINGKDTESFGPIEMAGPSYFEQGAAAPPYDGIQAVMFTEFDGAQPVIATFNANEKKGVAQLEYTLLEGQVSVAFAAHQARLKKLALKQRFPLKDVPLKKCPAKGASSAPTSRPAGAAGPSVCTGIPHCIEVKPFAATVTDFRTSSAGGTKVITLNLRFQNRTDAPLTLGYVHGSGIVTDDRGNRYGVSGAGAVRGIGEITGNTFDPKFTLQPGEASDARVEFQWTPGRGQIFGTTYEVELAVRSIEPLPGNQYQLGREYALKLDGFSAESPVAGAQPGGATGVSGATATAGAPMTPPTAAPAAAAGAQVPADAPDACAGKQRCYNAGPFAAEVTQVTTSKYSYYVYVHLNVKVRNVSAQPLWLAYQSSSATATDDVGNRYAAPDAKVKGIGFVNRYGADPQFALNPGQSRSIAMTYVFRPGRAQLGTAWAADFVLQQLEILPSRQVRSVREYSVSFTDLTAGAGGAGIANPSSDVNAAGATTGSDAAAAAATGLLGEIKKAIKKKN